MVQEIKLSKEQRKWFDRIRVRAVSNGATAEDMGAPYLAPAIFRLSPVPVTNDSGIKWMAVDDRGRVYINFDEVMKMSEEWGAGAIVHEVWHVLRQHSGRAKNADVRDYSRWNQAGDLEINAALPKRFQKEMTQILYPSQFKLPDNETAEWYYLNMPKQKSDCPQCQEEQKRAENGNDQSDKQSGGNQDSDQGQDGNESGDKGQGGQDGDQDGKGQQGGKGGQGQDGDQDGQGGGQGGQQGQGGHQHGNSGQSCPEHGGNQDGNVGSGQCGSGAGGRNRSYEVDGNESGETPEWSKTDREFLKREVAKRVREQAQKNSSKGIGNIPGGLLEWAEVVLAPAKVRWQDVFRSKIHTAVKYRRGFKTINRRRVARRQPIPDLIIPAWNDTQLTAAAALDDSGSNLSNIPGALSEVFNMLRVAGLRELDFFTVDMVGGEVQKLRRATDKVKLEGGGGTDMRVAFQKLHELGRDVGIIFTDSATPWPTEAEYEELLATGKTRYIIGALIGSDYDEQAYNAIPPYLAEITVKVDLREGNSKDVYGRI